MWSFHGSKDWFSLVVWYRVSQLDLKPDCVRTRKVVVSGIQFIPLREIKTLFDPQYPFHLWRSSSSQRDYLCSIHLCVLSVRLGARYRTHVWKIIVEMTKLSGIPSTNFGTWDVKSWAWRWAGALEAPPLLCTLFPLSRVLVTCLSLILYLERQDRTTHDREIFLFVPINIILEHGPQAGFANQVLIYYSLWLKIKPHHFFTLKFLAVLAYLDAIFFWTQFLYVLSLFFMSILFLLMFTKLILSQ